MSNCKHKWGIEIITDRKDNNVEFKVDEQQNQITCFFGVNMKCKKCGKYLDETGGVVMIRKNLQTLGLVQRKKSWFEKLFK